MANPTTATIRNAAQEIAKAGEILPHQLAALSALDQALSPEQRQAFTADWRAKGSPAAPPPAARPTNPLTGFPYFSQLDNQGGTGYRECQTSAIAMCLAYLGAGGITSDDEYRTVVRRYGDTTSQVSHQLALKALGVRARFVINCSASQAQGEIKAGLPVAMGILHKGHVSQPAGGGHWVVAYGFDARHFVVNDPYGELDLVNGTWVRTGGNSGKGLRYSYRNLTPRWQVEGAGSGWAWLFP
jgi:hypothetical protein